MAEPAVTPADYTQPFRPQYHFSPVRGWIGDPDGTVRWQGVYHLFWWGHAESTDLVHWKERPFPNVNLPGVDSGSGSVFIDERNASGLAIPGQNPPMLAFFTILDADGAGRQAPGLAVSFDYTRFAYYGQNPLVLHEEKAFRDPQVFFHPPSGRYIMAIALADARKIAFYSSQDLLHWQHLSDFGPAGDYAQVWECPDLFELPLDGDPGRKKWVLLVGVGPNKEQYFIGDFDGERFTLDPASAPGGEEPALWLDRGPDYYAARTYRDFDRTTDRVVLMGWLGNWEYASLVPTTWGRGSAALPREIQLRTLDGRPRIVQRPIPALESLRRGPVRVGRRVVDGVIPLSEFQPARNCYEIDLAFATGGPRSRFGIRVAENGSRGVTVGYDAGESSLFIDRTQAENAEFSQHFARYASAPLAARDGNVRLRIFVDQSSIEVFANDGEQAMSALMFPGPLSLGISLFAQNGSARLFSLDAWELESIWLSAGAP